MYSQSNEEQYIIEAVNHIQNGVFLEIGAYHPFKFSNTRALVERGWSGVYVEPMDDLMLQFENEYGYNDNIQLIKKAVATHTGNVTFYDSHGDAIGTIDSAHADKWAKGWNVEYSQKVVPCVTVADLIDECKFDHFDFVSIDVEGVDLQILQQFDFAKINTTAVIVEHNQINTQAYRDFMNNAGFIEIFSNGENLIFRK